MPRSDSRTPNGCADRKNAMTPSGRMQLGKCNWLAFNSTARRRCASSSPSSCSLPYQQWQQTTGSSSSNTSSSSGTARQSGRNSTNLVPTHPSIQLSVCLGTEVAVDAALVLAHAWVLRGLCTITYACLGITSTPLA